MGKQADEKDPTERLRSKLAKGQLKLHAAEAKHAQARERGKQEIEKARLRAAQREAKARERVERRVNTVARLEARLVAAESREDRERTESTTLEAPPDSTERRLGAARSGTA